MFLCAFVWSDLLLEPRAGQYGGSAENTRRMAGEVRRSSVAILHRESTVYEREGERKAEVVRKGGRVA